MVYLIVYHSYRVSHKYNSIYLIKALIYFTAIVPPVCLTVCLII